jgi:hypothetical protein
MNNIFWFPSLSFDLPGSSNEPGVEPGWGRARAWRQRCRGGGCRGRTISRWLRSPTACCGSPVVSVQQLGLVWILGY